jgi:PAS domain S-box-containing protein
MFDADHGLHRVLMSAPDPTLIVDGTGTILFASSQIEPVFGYEPGELVRTKIEALIPKRFHQRHPSLFSAYFSAPTPRPMGAGLELYAQRKDGTEFPVEISLSPVSAGSDGYVICAIRDVTERRKMEAELRAAKTEAERANAVKSRFLAAASHDLRQPLQACSVYLSLLKKQATSSEQQEACAKMRTPLEGMAGILDALLDISMLDSGMIEPKRSDFALGSVIARVIADLTPLAEQKKISLEYTDTGIVVNSDPALLERILENLVSNAVRYTNHGRVQVSAAADTNVARISVTDTGIGIPPEALDKIFDEYFQYDNPARNSKKGLGLGLAVVKRLSGLLGHPISVNSAIGYGSTFTVELPSMIGTAVLHETPVTALSKDRQKVTVLFVDDDSAVVDSLRLFFAVASIEARSAMNGDEAVAHIVGGFRPDVIISDYRLPNENGLTVLARVRDALRLETPAILMSGDTSLRHIEAQNVPKVVVVQKPFDADELLALIEEQHSTNHRHATDS